MNFCKISLLLCLQLIFVYCNKLENATDAAAAFEKSTSSSLYARKARATYDFVYADLIGCAVQSDASCLVNVAEDFLSIKKNELLSEYLTNIIFSFKIIELISYCFYLLFIQILITQCLNKKNNCATYIFFCVYISQVNIRLDVKCCKWIFFTFQKFNLPFSSVVFSNVSNTAICIHI